MWLANGWVTVGERDDVVALFADFGEQRESSVALTHSLRITNAGSVRNARRAGTKLATIVTTASMAAMDR